MNHLTTLIFDFDGVILESVDIKTQAFVELFADFPRHREDIIKLHMQNGGMSRYEKFKIIYKEFLKRPLSDAKNRELGKTFSNLVFEKVVNCPFVCGAYEFLKKYASAFPIFVASGTPENELIEIVRRRNLAHFFKSIHGSPKTKPEIIDDIISTYNYSPEQILFIGDSTTDYEAAKCTNIRFIGRVDNDEKNIFPGHITVVKDLFELDPYIFKTVN